MAWAILALQVAAASAAAVSAWYWFRGSRFIPRPAMGRRAAVWAVGAAGLAALSAILGALT